MPLTENNQEDIDLVLDGSGSSDAPLRLNALLDQLPAATAAYRSAAPWPNLVVEGLVHPQLLADAEREEEEFARRLRAHRSHREVKAESPEPSGPAARRILDALLDPAFIEILEKITGVASLVGDPEHHWAGLHVSSQGAFQSVHTDFQLHPVTNFHHRANVLVYLNSQWSSSYGGHLELWPPDMSHCGRRIVPRAGTAVIFKTDPGTPHGLPDPLACPEDRVRLSLASYYYTEERDRSEPNRNRFVLPRRPGDPWHRSFFGVRDAMTEVRRVAGRTVASLRQRQRPR